MSVWQRPEPQACLDCSSDNTWLQPALERDENERFVSWLVTCRDCGLVSALRGPEIVCNSVALAEHPAHKEEE